ncbi:GTPase IMAP family member 4-like [Thalassophryne amazonica]|uniref:GTPase IMAP family member 4-like n=1 Tax=Thalassophryne amazonica TaxID=390379 RepID=UPI001470F1E7|nr:GTPase IMAP family member 4-like [Thalassophryne amazonica]
MSHMVVLLLGEKQSGKSSAGNTILGRQAFPKATTRSSKETGNVLGKQVTIVDTPGWLSHSPTPERVSKELRRGLDLCRPAPHAILMVLPITSNFNQQNLRAMEVQLTLLHTPILQRSIVLFTYGDMLGDS